MKNNITNLLKAGFELNMEDGRLKANFHAEVTDEGMDALHDVFDTICKSIAERKSAVIEYREDDEDEEEDIDEEDDDLDEEEESKLDNVSELIGK